MVTSPPPSVSPSLPTHRSCFNLIASLSPFPPYWPAYAPLLLLGRKLLRRQLECMEALALPGRAEGLGGCCELVPRSEHIVPDELGTACMVARFANTCKPPQTTPNRAYIAVNWCCLSSYYRDVSITIYIVCT